MKAKSVARTSDRARASPRVRRGARRPGELRSAAALLRRPGALLQPALRVGAANDPLEREAEATAERVVSMPAPEPAAAASAPPGGTPPGGTPPGGAPPGGESADSGMRRSAEDQPNLDELESAPEMPADHVEPTVAPDEDVEATELGADDLKEIESERPSDPGVEEPPPEQPLVPSPYPPVADEPVQAARTGEARAGEASTGAVVGPEGGAAPPSVAARVQQPGAGRPLPEPVRAFMEPRFGTDFSGVRLHDQPEDRLAARRIGARAFTHRDHIWLGPGESTDDRRLLAHELTHVVQQTGGRSGAEAGEAAADRQIARADAPIRRAGWVAEKAEGYARDVPGYTLISVLLGESPITGDRVPRTATNLIGGFLGLIPGGNRLFERLQETRALERAYEWVTGRLSSLNITWARVSRLIDEVIDLFPTWSPIAGIKRIFAPLVRDLITFISDIAEKILEFIVKGALSLAGPYGEKVWEVIQQAGETISMILEDPLGFAKNLFASVIKGFQQFGTNIVEHLKKGLMGWLFGAIQGLEITIPEKLDFKGLISIGLQVLGLTYDRFRDMLVKKLGPNGERKVAYLEKSVEVVKILVTEGFVGIWQKMLSLIDGFKQKMIGGIQEFVITTLVKGGLSWLAGLSNPVGAVVKVVLSIYNMIVTFLERIDQIVEVAKSIFSSIGAIAKGQIQQAADFIEKTIGATIPIVISFLAALVPVTGITAAIRKIIKKLREPVDNALKKLLAFVVKKAKKVLAKIIGKLNSKRKLPSANFKIGDRVHQYFVKKKGKKADVYVKSEPQTTDEAEAGMRRETPKFQEGSASRNEAQATTSAFDTQEDRAEAAAGQLKPGDPKVNQEGPNKKMQKTLADGAKVISEQGAQLGDNPDVDTQHPQLLIRAVEPRFPEEGTVDTYSKLKKLSGQEAPGTGLAFSAYYEADHLPEKSLLQGVNAQAAALAAADEQDAAAAEGAGDVVRATEDATPPAGKPEQATQKPKGFGQLAQLADEPGGDGKSLKAILIYRPVHREKPNTFAKATLARVDEILASKASPVAKEASIKAALGQQIHDEAKAVKTLYTELDKNSAGDVRGRVFAGLDSLVEQSNTLYDLAAAKAAHSEADVGTGGEDGGRNELTFDGPQNFSGREGEIKAYGQLGATGPFFERDHIVDKSFPLAIQNLTIGDEKIWNASGVDALKPPAKAEDPAAAAAAMEERRRKLKAERLFPDSSSMAGYTENNGVAMFVYRPVHRRVTAATVSGNAKNALVGALQTSAFASARGYVSGRKGSSLLKAKDAVRQALRKPFRDQTNHHVDAVKTEYNSEAAKVVAANPGREQQAAAAMQAIRNRVETNLGTMRTQSLNLFS